MLVALVIFGIITVALSFTFDTAMKTQIANTRRLEELGAVRSVFDYMTRDIQQAYASSNNQAAVFVVGQSGQGSTSNGVATGLVTLMTRGNRLVTDVPSTTGATTGPAASSAAPPQSDLAMVRYDFDPQAKTLSRTVVGVPSLDALQQAQTDDSNVICSRVKDITIQVWDPTNQTWRNDWDYEQQVQAAANQTAGGSSGSTGAAGATGAAPTTPGTTNSSGGDTTLPSQVQISVTIEHADSTTATYTATIPVLVSQVADGMEPPTNTTTTTTGSTQ